MCSTMVGRVLEVSAVAEKSIITHEIIQGMLDHSASRLEHSIYNCISRSYRFERCEFS